ncbi:hypothetical protein CSIRO_0782 [Bradyrhizobiaceae bacterium SG-6C]|nr:hypothetical protein CSIRO_0782 [Bradyrhizobiaceae bacterium SG-6C]
MHGTPRSILRQRMNERKPGAACIPCGRSILREPDQRPLRFKIQERKNVFLSRLPSRVAGLACKCTRSVAGYRDDAGKINIFGACNRHRQIGPLIVTRKKRRQKNIREVRRSKFQGKRQRSAANKMAFCAGKNLALKNLIDGSR